MFINVWNWPLLRSEGNAQNWVRRRSDCLNLCEAHGLNTWGQLPHLMNNGRKIQYFCGELCAPRCPGFYRPRSSCSTSRTSPTSLSQEYEKYCVQQQYEVRKRVNKHKETCYKPSHKTTNKHGETRYRLNCHEERCNRKRIQTHFLKHRNCEMQEGKKYLDTMQVSWIEVKSFRLLLQSTNQQSKFVETTKTYRSKLSEVAEWRYAKWRKEPLRNCCNWPLDGGWIPWWIATICKNT